MLLGGIVRDHRDMRVHIYSLLRGLRKGSLRSGMETWHPFKKTNRDFCFNSNGCGFVSVFFFF